MTVFNPKARYRIKNTVTTTIRELAAGSLYVRVADLRSKGAGAPIRQRTEDPFRSLTRMGSQCQAFPSDRVHPVEEVTP